MTRLQAAVNKLDTLCADDDWQLEALCLGMLHGYQYRWGDAQKNITLVECESVLTSPLINLQTGKPSRTYSLAGKVDKVADIKSVGRVLIDHKTTSQDISDPTSAYWRQLAVDSQGSFYQLLLLANGIQLDGIEWDVARKPGIRPKKISAKDREQVLSSGTYCNFKMGGETLEGLVETPQENAQLYAARVARECISNKYKYYARRSNPRTNDQLAEYAEELWGGAKLIRDAKKTNSHFRNSGACFNFGRPCQFLPLCSGMDDPHSDAWVEKPQTHMELTPEMDGKILTHSRLRKFQTCRRKHYYEYEMGIERVGAPRSEALHFGNVWHQCLDAWWQAHSEGERDDDDSEQLAGKN